jgi:NAD(P)H-hydrate epimerase
MIRLNRQQVREVDRRAMEVYGIPGIVLMENAARGATAAAMSMLRGEKERGALVLCGGGNNGGDGLAVARHLHNRGIEVTIGLCSDPGKYQGDALINWRIVKAMGLACVAGTAKAIEGTSAGLIVDAIFGTGLKEAPRAPFASIVKAVEQTGRAVLAIDVPSGLDCDTGEPLGACMRARRTVTFVAEKTGFGNPGARRFTGRIIVADIGCPRELVDEVVRESSGSEAGAGRRCAGRET